MRTVVVAAFAVLLGGCYENHPMSLDGSAGCACGPAEFCRLSASCGGRGRCEPRPDDCLGEPIAEVCGCDGLAYRNECEANAAGQSATRSLPCRTPSCTSSAECAADETCDFGDSCAMSGRCVPRPEICPPGGPPVCSCGGRFYESECEARLAGDTPTSDIGRCEMPPPPANCIWLCEWLLDGCMLGLSSAECLDGCLPSTADCTPAEWEVLRECVETASFCEEGLECMMASTACFSM